MYRTPYRPRFDHCAKKVSAWSEALLLYMRGTADLKLFAGSPGVADICPSSTELDVYLAATWYEVIE
jgi:hypothetical protein